MTMPDTPELPPTDAIVDALDHAKHMLREAANVGGYGFYRPKNPNDFHPDPECCSPEEIANHKAACEAWDRGDYKRDDWDGWVYDGAGTPVMHVLRAPWGIGSYCETDEAMEARAQVLHDLSERIPAILASRATRLAEAPKGWKPIETAPKDGTLFLVWIDGERRGEDDDGRPFVQSDGQVDFAQWRETEHGGYVDCFGNPYPYDAWGATHWMPLPTPPSGVKS